MTNDLPSLDEDLKGVGLSATNEPMKEIGFPEDRPVGPKQRFRFYEVTMGSAPEQLRPLTPEAQQALQEMGLQPPTPEDPRVQVHALTREEIAQIRPPQPSFTALDFEVWDYLTRTKGYQPGQLVTAEEVEKALLQVDGKYDDLLHRSGAGDNMYYSALVKFGEAGTPAPAKARDGQVALRVRPAREVAGTPAPAKARDRGHGAHALPGLQ